MTKKNIMVIISDQQRTDTIGYLRRTPCRTPNIDELINRGGIFERTVTPTPVSTPAGAYILTGLFAQQPKGIYAKEHIGPLRDDQITADATAILLSDYSDHTPIRVEASPRSYELAAKMIE